MNVQDLGCVRCGGPLPRLEAVPGLVDCLFCGSVNSVGHDALRIQEAMPWDVRQAKRKLFLEALKDGLARKLSPYEALRSASAAHLGVAGQSEVVATITIALARDFEAENQCEAVNDAQVLARIAEGYLKALDDLSMATSAEISLPFLTANSSGPKHLQRSVTATLLTELSRRDPEAAPKGQAVPVRTDPASEPSAPKKRWWQF